MVTEMICHTSSAGKEKMDRPSVLVIVAALNEEEGIGPTIAELKQFLEDSRILVVDGKSCDRTLGIARAMGAETMRQEGKGKGAAIASAISYSNVDADFVVLIDADYTYPASYLPAMISTLERNPQIGMVSGNRVGERLDVGAFHNLLVFGNLLLAFVHDFFNGVEMHDPLTGLRVIRAEVIRGWRPKSKGFDIEVELNHRVERTGYSILEMPIVYRSRLGRKKLKMWDGVTILKRIMMEAAGDLVSLRS